MAIANKEHNINTHLFTEQLWSNMTQYNALKTIDTQL